ncbi:protein-L-isoaspartate O-methyltransferase, partial [Candidatus Pacearchaeota archaeon]|nr:protein-L-isoaspartate O-methyltransferase [Candidatus Pacearchaeota archaeon]
MNKEELIKFLEKRGYTKEVIDAFREVKREEFVPEHLIP